MRYTKKRTQTDYSSVKKKKRRKKSRSQPFAYDDAYRTMETECDDILLLLVNYIFEEHYDDTAIITRLRNEHFFRDENKISNKRITDSFLSIEMNGIKKKYHIECESNNSYNGSMLLRIFEYATLSSKDDANVSFDKLSIDMPHSALILLRSSPNAPDKAEIEINTPGGSISYEVPVIKEADFDIDMLFDRKLYFLIPFYIFNYEHELEEINSDPKRLDELQELYETICQKLEKAVENNELSPVSYGVIISATEMVIKKLAVKMTKVKEKVGDIMGGRVMDLEILRVKHALDAANERANKAIERADKADERANKAEEENRRLRAEVEKLRELVTV